MWSRPVSFFSPLFHLPKQTARFHSEPVTPPSGSAYDARQPSPVRQTADVHCAREKNSHSAHFGHGPFSVRRQSLRSSHSLRCLPELATCRTHTPRRSSCHELTARPS